MTVRVRFAPSPTGHLHIGGARTALFNYLFAKKHKGTYILRIEDTDRSRNKENAEAGFIEGFKWLGLSWDEGPDVGGAYGPYRSMERLDIYREYIEQLLAEGKAYRCYCTKEELEAEKEEMVKEGKIPRYSGKCRHLCEDDRQKYEAENRSFTIRFRVPDEEETLSFHDLIRGDVSFSSQEMDDFVIVKSDGIPTFHFAVTVDDGLMKITHVIRGEEHLSNTPKHILLFKAFNFPVPQFAHIPLILNEDGKKLSKRDESILQFIEQYRDLGYLPEAVNNYLALLGWSPAGEYAEQEIFSMGQLIEQFSLERISKAGAIFDPEKLAWMNGQYIKAADVDRLTNLAQHYLAHLQLPEERIRELVLLFQTGMNAVSEIVDLSNIFFQDDVTYDEEAKEILTGESVSTVLPAFKEKLLVLEDYNADVIKQTLKAVQKETGYKGKQLFMPIRVAATGQTHGPDLNQTLYLLGKEKVIRRLEQVINGEHI